MSERLSAKHKEVLSLIVNMTREELLQPITDKSICKRGHSRACLVIDREVTNTIDGVVVEHRIEQHCSACRQLEAELKPLKELLTKFISQHDDLAGKITGDWMGMTMCQCDLCKAARECRGW